MRCVNLLTLVLLILCPFILHAEDADEVREKGIAALKDSQTNPHAIVEAARHFVKAAALYGDAGNEEKNVEMNSFLYWCKKKMTLEDIEQFTKGGEAAVTGKLAALDKLVPKADDAQKWFDRADQFAKKNPNEHLLIAIRFFEVADRFKGSDASFQAQDRSLKEQLSDKNSTVKTVPQPTTLKPTETVANDIAKRPVPLADDLKASEKLIKDLLKADYAKTDAPSRLALIAKLLQQADENKNDAALEYVCLHEARDLAVLAGDVTKAAEVQLHMRDAFKSDFAAILLDLKRLESSAKTAEPATALAALFAFEAERAFAEADYDQAVRFNSRVEDLLPLSKDAALKVRLKTEIPRVQAIKRESVGALAAQKTLATKPDDAEANLTAGKFALLLGDVEKSMALLAKSKDAVLSGLANRELAQPKEAAEQAQLADGWFDRAEKEGSTYLKGRMQDRAALWYATALPGLAGVAKLKVEARMKTLPQAGGSAATGQVSKSNDSVPQNNTGKFDVKKELVLDLGGGIKMELIPIPAGTFAMGSPPGKGRGDERQHTVTISKPYFIGKFPVTQEQYEAIIGSNPSKFTGPRNPVDQVIWKEAEEFCDKMTEKTKDKIPAGYRVQLPTEAQWEYACRAGTKTQWYSGDTETELETVAWFDRNGEGKTHPVGEKKPNAWGLYDMHGNVWQWCQDWKEDYQAKAQTDPQGPVKGTMRSLRGGSFTNSSGDARSAFRANDIPDGRNAHQGFRVVLSFDANPVVKKPAVVTGDAGKWIDLLAMIHPVKNAEAGNWKLENGVLTSNTENGARISIPYIPPEEYDYRIFFSRNDGGSAVLQYATRQNREIMWCIGWRIVKFALNEKDIEKNTGMKNGQKNISVIKVRKGSVQFYFNDRLILEEKDEDRLFDTGTWCALQNKSVLGIGSHFSPTSFYKVELLEVTGKGKPLP